MAITTKIIEVVGLGACGVDYISKVNSFADKNNKVTSHDVSLHPGGLTTNNLVQTSRLGLRTAWCGMLGKDDLGRFLQTNLKKEHIAAVYSPAGKTQFAWIIVDQQGEREIYVFPNASLLLTPELVEKNFKRTIQQSRHFHTEIAVIPLAAAIRGAELAKEAKAKVFLDVDGNIDVLLAEGKIGTKEQVRRLLHLADVVKLSTSAAKALAGKMSMKELVQKLLLHSSVVAITLGEKGCYIADRKNFIYCPAAKVSCVDSTGAGDAFMGGLSYAILKGMTLPEIGRFANACGAYNCMNFGARSSGTLRQVEALFIKN